MNDQYKYFGQHLTPSITQELIRELFAGETVQVQHVKNKIDEVHKERGGELSKDTVNHPVTYALSRLKQSGLAENPNRGIWSILPEEAPQNKVLGETPLIKTLDEFMAWAKTFDRGECVFRGVPNAGYGIQASAFRRPDKDRNFEKFLHINKDLIREARLRGYDQKDGQELKELEILADLQHFRAATCLIDFTYSAQVALFFACQPTPKKPHDCEKPQKSKEPPNGKVFVVRNQPPRFKEITPKLLRNDIDYFLKDSGGSQLYHWQPRHQNHRIIAQQSIFLFGNYEFDPDDKCIIAENCKQDILSELQKVSGITEDRLFPDFEGFARVRGEDEPYTELTPSEYKTRGFLASERGDYKDAIADYDIAIDKDPNYAEAYYLRGLAQKSLGEQEKAIVDFDDAVRLNPNHIEAYYSRGDAKFSLQQYEEAIIDFDDVVRLSHDYAKAYYLRGGAKYNLERYEEAIIDFDDTIRLDPKHTDAYYWRGRAKYSLKRYEEAIVDFDDVIRLSPQHRNGYYWRGVSKRRLGQNDASIPDFDIAIRLMRISEYTYYHRGYAKFELDRFAEAKADLEEALSLARQNDNDEIMRLALNLLHEID